MMLYIILAITASTSIIVLLKIFNKININTFAAITVNYVVATAFGFAHEAGNFNTADLLARPWFVWAMISGGLFIVGFNLFAISTKNVGVALTGMASRMSMVVSVLAGLFLFAEEPTWIRTSGIVVGLAAFYFTFNKGIKSDGEKKFFIIPFALLLVHGFSDLMMKVAQHYYISGDFVLFLSTTFFWALIFAIIYTFYKGFKSFKISFREISGGAILGIINWYSGYFLLLSLDSFDVSVVIPTINISIVVASLIAGKIFFYEKLNASTWLGIALAIIAILFISNG